MGIGAPINNAVRQAQPTQTPQQPQPIGGKGAVQAGSPLQAQPTQTPQPIGGKGGALNQVVQPSMQRPEPLQQQPQGAFPRFDPSLVFPRQPTQQPPQQMGGKGGALSPTQGMQSVVRPDPQAMGGKGGGAADPYAQRLGVYNPNQMQQPIQQTPIQSKMQQQMQQQMQQAPMQQQAPISSYQDQNPLAGQTQSAMGNFAAQQAMQQQMQQQAMQNAYAQPLQQMPMQQMQQQPAMNPAIQNILRRSRGLGGKGMR
jgi:hypothetical protein